MDLAKLKELAQAATPGPWTECGHGHEQDGCVCGMVYAGLVPAVCTVETDSPAEGVHRSREKKRADAAFIAAANPQTVLGLIAEVERLRAELDNMTKLYSHRCDMFTGMAESWKQSEEKYEKLFAGWDRLWKENAQLRAENERLRFEIRWMRKGDELSKNAG